jgi:hypothetical protein
MSTLSLRLGRGASIDSRDHASRRREEAGVNHSLTTNAEVVAIDRTPNRTDCNVDRASTSSAGCRGPGATPHLLERGDVVGNDTAGRTIIQLAVDDWTLERLMTFDAEAAELEDGGNSEPDADDEEDGPPVLIEFVRPKVVRRMQVRAFGQVD